MSDTDRIIEAHMKNREDLVEDLLNERRELQSQLAAERDRNQPLMLQLGMAVRALERIKAHGCCIMHNDARCPGCEAHDTLTKIREAKAAR